jgi:adenine/guanine/hypoxanthine permease
MASMIVMGLLKFVLSFAGAWVGRVIPRAGLLGSIAAIALMLIGFLPMVEVMQVPIVGFVSLGVILYAVVAKGRLPGRVPGVLAAVVAGLVLYYALGPFGLAGPGFKAPGALTLRFALPVPSLGFIDGLGATVPYLPLILPFGLLMVIGGINVTESARVAGRRLQHPGHPAHRGLLDARGRPLRGRRADDALHRPARLQEDGGARRATPS